jgi:hypothetical protein
MSVLIALVGGVASAWLGVLARRDRRWSRYVAGVAVVLGSGALIERTRGDGSASVLVYLAVVGIGMLINPQRRPPPSGADRGDA